MKTRLTLSDTDDGKVTITIESDRTLISDSFAKAVTDKTRAEEMASRLLVELMKETT